VAQQTAAASTAWLIARHVVHHRQPFFAPVAAVVALNATRGERGTNAVRLVLGVIVGILAADLAMTVLHHGYGALAAAALLAMMVALALGGERIVIAQAAVGAILAVAVGGAAGAQRLVDATIGSGVALVFSQLVFPAEPVVLLRRAESAVLESISSVLRLTAQALERDDDSLDAEVAQHLRSARDLLVDLARARESSRRTIRHSPLWWGRVTPISLERHNAERLDLLGSSCLMLARLATAHRMADSGELADCAPDVRELAVVLEELARAPGDHETRRRAARHALNVVHRRAAPGTGGDGRLAALQVAVRMAATDLMAFAGVDPARATDLARAAQTDLGELAVPAPPPTLWARLRNRRHGSHP
jgi:uncharacterized membrane protein YgaE (UPF0421/DUF939 family)